MAVTDSGDVKKQALSDTNSTEVDFEYLINGVHIKTDANVYVAFDRDATTSDFLLEADDRIHYFRVRCTKVYLKAASTANVYLVGTR